MTAEPTIQVPYFVERDEDGVWCARAYLNPSMVAYGDGDTEQAAIHDLSEGMLGLVEELGYQPTFPS